MNKKVQILRALAIIAVVTIHTIPNNFIAIFIRPFTNFCVAMFIFLSGYLTNPHVEDIGRFYRKRLSRVLIPYIIWTCIYCIIYRSSVRVILFSLLTSTVSYAFYYCFVYAQLVLITPWIGKNIDKKYSWILALIQPVFILIVQYLLNCLHRPIPSPWNAIFFCSWLTYYFMGLKMKSHSQKADIKLYIILALSIILQIIEGMFWFYFENADMATSQAKISTMLTNIILMVIACGWLNNGKKLAGNLLQRILETIGDCSFGIYLSHVLIITLISNKMPIYNSLFPPVKTICVFLISLISVLIGRRIVGKKFGRYLGLY